MSSNEPSNRRSLESRLMRLLLLGCGTLFLLTGLLLDRVLEHWMRADFDRSLEAQARALISLSEQQDGIVEFDFVADLMPEFGDEDSEDDDREDDGGEDDEDEDEDEEDNGAGDEAVETETEYFQLWLDGDQVFERSPSLGAANLSRGGETSPQMRFSDVTLLSAAPGRQVQVDFVPQVETDPEHDEDIDVNEPGLTGLDPTAAGADYRIATLVVARPTAALSERIVFFRWTLAGSGLLLLGLLAVLVRLAVRSGLRPLRAVTHQVDSLEVERLDQRIKAEPPAELAPLVHKLNDLLARLEAAFERERRFSSDVAHELRTPIAELRSLAEVGGRWPDDRIAVRQFFGDTQAIAEQMEQVVSQLLMVARTEAGIETVDTERIDLAGTVAGTLHVHEANAVKHGTDLHADVPNSLWLDTDPAKFELILHNLLSNAVTHTPEGGRIDLRAMLEDGSLTLTVSNPADNLSEDDLPHIYDRFWRKDEARANPGSSGLGLALVKSLCDLMGIAVDAFLDHGVFRLSLRFPQGAAGVMAQRAAS